MVNHGDRILHSRLDAQRAQTRLVYLRHIMLCLRIMLRQRPSKDDKQYLWTEVKWAKICLSGGFKGREILQ